MENEFKNMNTLDLAKALLHKLECKYEMRDDETILFSFQGEHFILIIPKNAHIVRIWDCGWFNVPLDNIEELSCIKKAINTSNINDMCVAVYTVNKDDNTLEVHSNKFAILVPEIPEVENYFRFLLESFFIQHRNLYSEFDKEKLSLGI